MNDELFDIAGELWAAYSAEVGGKAFNGDPLPTWEELIEDGSKHMIVTAWLAVAKKASEIFV